MAITNLCITEWPHRKYVYNTHITNFVLGFIFYGQHFEPNLERQESVYLYIVICQYKMIFLTFLVFSTHNSVYLCAGCRQRKENEYNTNRHMHI